MSFMIIEIITNIYYVHVDMCDNKKMHHNLLKIPPKRWNGKEAALSHEIKQNSYISNKQVH